MNTRPQKEKFLHLSVAPHNRNFSPDINLNSNKNVEILPSLIHLIFHFYKMLDNSNSWKIIQFPTISTFRRILATPEILHIFLPPFGLSISTPWGLSSLPYFLSIDLKSPKTGPGRWNILIFARNFQQYNILLRFVHAFTYFVKLKTFTHPPTSAVFLYRGKNLPV